MFTSVRRTLNSEIVRGKIDVANPVTLNPALNKDWVLTSTPRDYRQLLASFQLAFTWCAEVAAVSVLEVWPNVL